MHQTGITTEYGEPQKVLTRKQLIESAIGALTADRTNVTLGTCVGEMRDTLIASGGYEATPPQH